MAVLHEPAIEVQPPHPFNIDGRRLRDLGIAYNDGEHLRPGNIFSQPLLQQWAAPLASVVTPASCPANRIGGFPLKTNPFPTPSVVAQEQAILHFIG